MQQNLVWGVFRLKAQFRSQTLQACSFSPPERILARKKREMYGTGLGESSVAFLDRGDGSASRRPQQEMRQFRNFYYALFPICRGGKIFEIEYTSTWLVEKAKVAKMAAPGPGDRRGSSQ